MAFLNRLFFSRVPLWVGILLLLAITAVTLTPVRATSATVVISEVMYDPTTSEPAGEWIELHNISPTAIDLSNYKIGDEETSGGSEGMFEFPGAATILFAQTIVIANDALAFQANYGFLPDYELTNSSSAVPDMIKYSTWASGNIGLANSGDEVVLLDETDTLVDSLSWGSSNWAFNPDAPDVAAGRTLDRNPVTVDTDSATDWVNQANPNPGTVTGGGAPTPTPMATNTPNPTNTPPPSCGKTSSYTAVWEVQGSGHTSPLNGQSVNNVRGIVTANFQAGTGGPQEPRGFFIQAHEPDCNVNTSDGILVYTGSTAQSISVGDLVEIDGSGVTEYQGPSFFVWEATVTELSCTSGCNVTTLQTNYGVPAAEEYTPPDNETAALAYNEAREGMLMQVTTNATAIGPSNAYNEFVVRRGSGQDRVHHDGNNKGSIIMVDGDGVAAAKCGQDGFGDIRTFDTIAYNPTSGFAIYGPLNYNFNLYKVQQDDDAFCISSTLGNDSSYDPADNPAPAADANTLTIASMNAWNFFDTNNDSQKSDDIPSQAEYDQHALKLANAICSSNGLNQPLIIGFQEVENGAVLQKLVGDVNNVCGASYAYHTLAGPDNRSIEVAFLTRTDRVTVLAFNDRQGCSSTNWGITYAGNDHPADVTCSGGTPYYLFNRPPMQLEAQITLAGNVETVHVFANHFKSKLSSSSCTISDCTDRRVEQAQHVDSLVDNILAGDANAKIVVLGDLNDYYNSAPLDELDKTNGVLTNLWDDLAGPPSSGQGTIGRYSYIYNGVAQTLDHMLVSDGLNSLSRTVSPRHLNVDWPASYLNDNSMFRSSDHDFLLAAFDFVGAPTSNNVIYVSSSSSGNAGGVAFSDEDILTYNISSGSWAIYLDGSDVGLSGSGARDIDAFHLLSDGTILLSVTSGTTLPNVGAVDDSDVVRFVPTSLGSSTAGTFEFYFDGSDVGLTSNGEDVDALHILDNGDLLISTSGSYSVSGASGGDEDLVRFAPTSLGTNTSGSWSVYFDGSDVGLNSSSSEDVVGVWQDAITGDIFLSTLGAFSVSGASGDAADVLQCDPSSIGSNTSCTFSLSWDGSTNGFGGEIIDSLHIE